jgi:hypothetical protein
MKTLISKFTVPVTVILILCFLKLLNPGFDDPDFYWHLKTGEYIVSHLSVPNTDPFAYTSIGKPWVAHEWLSEVIFYGVDRAFGFTGLSILIAATLCANFLVLFQFSRKLVKNETHALLICLAFLGPLLPYEAPRPQIFTFLLFSLLCMILLEQKYFGSTKKVFLIPILMPLWVNLHGGYAVGFALLALFLGCEWLGYLLAAYRDAATKRNLTKLSFAALLAVATANINPHFIQVWTYPFYLVSLEVAKGTITEWRSPDFHILFYKYCLLLIIGYFLALAYSRKKPDITELALPLFFICSAMVSQRHLPLMCITLLLFTSTLYPHLVLPTNWLKPMSKVGIARNAATRQMSPSTVAFLNILLVAILGGGVVYMKSIGKLQQAFEDSLPVKAADYIIENHITGNMLNEYGYGGYLIYRLSPSRKIFIDGRADMYGDAFVRQYLEIYNGGSRWKEELEKFSIDYVVCEKSAPIRQLLLTEGSFREAYADNLHSVLVRNVSPLAKASKTLTQAAQ